MWGTEIMRVGWVMWLQSGSNGAPTLEEEVEASIRQLRTTSEPPQNGSYTRQAKDECWARTEMDMYPRVSDTQRASTPFLSQSKPPIVLVLFYFCTSKNELTPTRLIILPDSVQCAE